MSVLSQFPNDRDVAYNEDLLQALQNYGDHSNLRIPSPAVDNQLCVGQPLVINNTPSSSGNQYTDQLCHDPVLAFARVANEQTSHSFGLWNPCDVEQPEQVMTCSPTVVNGQNTTSLVLSCTPTHLFPRVPHPENASPPDAFQNHLIPQLKTSGFLGTGFPPVLDFYGRLHMKSACSSHRKRTARAIQHNGLWIDEEELFSGLTGPEGKLTVHQCRWDESRSPCHLRISGDKSCINTHIQRWHGGKPGGDKLLVDCQWFGCGQTMLKESITRHIVNIHLGEMWECKGCGKRTVRSDVHRQHVLKSVVDACRTSGTMITYTVDTWEVDTRAALQSYYG